MFRRVMQAVRYAVLAEDFVPILRTGLLLVVIGTASFAPGEN
jgi:hypothetical protein